MGLPVGLLYDPGDKVVADIGMKAGAVEPVVSIALAPESELDA